MKSKKNKEIRMKKSVTYEAVIAFAHAIDNAYLKYGKI